MAEPATSTGSAIAFVVMGGIGASISETFGFSTGMFLSAMAGGYFGPLLADKEPWWRSALLFVAACVVSSLVAGALGKMLGTRESVFLNAFAGVIALVFRPAVNRLLERTNDVVDKGLDIAGIKKGPLS